MDAFETLEKLAASGFATFLIAVLWAGKARIWVWGYHLEDLRKDHENALKREREETDLWRKLALEGRDLVHRSVEVATKAVGAP